MLLENAEMIRTSPPLHVRPQRQLLSTLDSSAFLAGSEGDDSCIASFVVMAVYQQSLSFSIIVVAEFRQCDVVAAVAAPESTSRALMTRADSLHVALLRLQLATTVTRLDTAGPVTSRPAELWNDLVTLADPHIRAAVAGCGCPRAEYEDCVQEAWGEILGCIHLVDPASERGSLAGWLRTIARRTAFRMLRRRIRNFRVQTLPMASFACLPDRHQADPATEYDAREAATALVTAVDMLRVNVGEDAHQLVLHYLVDPSALTRLSLRDDLTAGRFWHLWRKAKTFLRTRLEPPNE